MTNLITPTHDFNKPIRFSRDGFKEFIEHLSFLDEPAPSHIWKLRDARGNRFTFRVLPIEQGALYAILQPEDSHIVSL